MPYAIRGTPFTLRCVVMKAHDMDEEVQFYNFHRNRPKTLVGSVLQSDTGCQVLKGTAANYQASCGTGTDDTTSNTKTYLLVTSETQSGVHSWYCQLKNDKSQSESLRLHLRGE